MSIKPGIEYFHAPENNWELKTCRNLPQASKAHCHLLWSLALVHEGSCVVHVLNKKIEVKAPAWVLFSPLTVHSCEPKQQDNWQFHMFYWNRLSSCSWAFQTGLLDSENLLVMNQFFKELEENKRIPGSLESWLNGLRGIEIQEQMESSEEFNCLNFWAEKLRKDFHDHYSLDKIVQETGIEKTRLVKKFKKYFGLPPLQYRLQYKTYYAKGLLLQGVAPVDAALQAGFYDQSHFNHAFRDFTGTTPGSYQGVL